MARRRRRTASNFKIPGVSFSLKRALGITAMKQRFARKTGIPTTRAGLERKIGRTVLGRGCLLNVVMGVVFAIGLIYLLF